MRAQKAAADQIMRAITIESEITRDREKKTRLAVLVKELSEPISRVRRLRADLEEAEKTLETFGVIVDYKDSVYLSENISEAIEKKAFEPKKRLEHMRTQMVIRFAVANEKEKAFLIRHFFAEVTKEFPSLQKLIGKVTP